MANACASTWHAASMEVAARRTGANFNALLDENLRDSLSVDVVLSGVPVRLEPENA
jgi:hypothetical protein